MKVVVVLLSIIFSLSSAYKILGIFPGGSTSHYAFGEAVMMALHEADHEVTMMSVFEPKKKMENYHHIKIADMTQKIVQEQKFCPFDYATWSQLSSLRFMYNFGYQTVEHVLSSDNVQKLINSNQKFDAVIVELFTLEGLLGFGQHFNCPIIGINAFDGVYWNDVYTGNDSPYSYVPSTFLGLPDKMTFNQRLKNTVFSSIEKLSYNFYHLRNQEKLYEKYFPKATKSFDEVHKGLSILFMNSHVSSTQARPMMPNMISIGGIHVKPAKALPDDIQSFLDSATYGVILFSMGSYIQSTDWTTQQREAFVNTFAKLKEKVLWKYENETLPGNPGNIMIGSWMPQRDVLAHHNVKLFITHGGNLGTTEAMSEGVPLLGLPILGDQMLNTQRAVEKGYALQLNFKNITEENFSEALNELLENPKYRENAKRLSGIFKDRPLTPNQSVVFWTEHVIRQNGADHLKSVGRTMSFNEFNLIDVYATLFAGAFGVFFVLCKVIGLFRKKSSQNAKKKTQ